MVTTDMVGTASLAGETPPLATSTVVETPRALSVRKAV
jgi:hypothetical protein